MASLEEQVPLLIEPRTDSNNEEIKYKAHPRQLYITVVMLLLILVLDLAGSLQLPAMVQILKDDVCWRHYGSSEGHLDCEADVILNEVTLINNIKDSLDVVPGMLLSIPMGILADRVGRRTILRLGLFSVFLNETWPRIVYRFWYVIPPRLVWLSPLCSCLGGGGLVAISMIWVIIADVTPAHQRTNVFYLAIAASIVSGLVASSIGAGLVARGYTWSTYMAAWGCLLAAVCLCFVIPETLRVTVAEPSDPPDSTIVREQPSLSVRSRTMARWRTWVSSTEFLRKDRNLPLLVGTFFMWTTTWECMVLLIVYASKKFHTSIGEASFLTPLTFASNLAALGALPLVSKILMNWWGISVNRKDQLLATCQTSLLAVAMTLIAWAPGHWVLFVGAALMGFGCAYDVSVRSLATELASPDHRGTLYGTMCLVRGLGGIIIGPVQAIAFRYNMSLPFLIGAVLYAITTIGLCTIRLPKQEKNDKENDKPWV